MTEQGFLRTLSKPLPFRSYNIKTHLLE